MDSMFLIYWNYTSWNIFSKFKIQRKILFPTTLLTGQAWCAHWHTHGKSVVEAAKSFLIEFEVCSSGRNLLQVLSTWHKALDLEGHGPYRKSTAIILLNEYDMPIITTYK